MNVKFLQKLMRRSRLLKFVNILGQVKIGNKRFKIPLIHEMGIGNLAPTEPWMMELIPDLLNQRPGTFVDIGANIGQTLLKLESIAPDTNYVGIEPNPACVYYLRELIKVNNFQNCTVIPTGCYDRDTLLELFMMSASEVNSGATVIQNYRPQNKIYDRQFVPVFAFDALVSAFGIEQIAIIKIDVEGAELEVIQGMRQNLSHHQPFMFVEILPAYNLQNGVRLERQEKIQEIMHELDYDIWRILKDPDNHLKELQKLEGFDIHADLNKCDYLFMPRSHGVRLE